jgi:hypothetical protein
VKVEEVLKHKLKKWVLYGFPLMASAFGY